MAPGYRHLIIRPVSAAATVLAELDGESEGTAMTRVRIDTQVRIIDPLARRRAVTVSSAHDRMPPVEFAKSRTVPSPFSNEPAVAVARSGSDAR